MWWHPGAGHACCLLSVGREREAWVDHLRLLYLATLSHSLLKTSMSHVAVTWNILQEQMHTRLPPLTDVIPAVCRWAFRATALRCIAQVFWLYPSVSYNLAGRAMFNIALLWWIYCSNPHTVLTKGCQASSDHDPFRSNTHLLAHGRAWVSHNILSYKSRFVRGNLLLT